MTTRPPSGIERMTHAEAWIDGRRAGREEMAAEYQRDAQAAAVAESPAGVKARDDRIAALERRFTGVENEQRDNATAVAKMEKRIEQLEGGKVE